MQPSPCSSVRRARWLALGASLAFCAFATGCMGTAEDDGLEPPPEGPFPFVPDEEIVDYPLDAGGTDKGDVMENIVFATALINALDFPDAAATEIQLADFYNPTGDGVFPEGSPFPAGTKKPRALLITMAARWCQPCRVEAKGTLPDKYAELGPKGAEFLLVLADGAKAGVRATEEDLRVWTGSFDTAYPAAIDEDSELAQHFQKEQYPANMIIDTTTMKIVERIVGIPGKTSGFWKLMASLVED
ncbi:MAG: redoxin domain-containing protein [Polyangiaceae bacterium]